MVNSIAFSGERGESLVEVLISVAVIAIVLGGFLAALSTGALSVAVVRERVTAENVARAQLECIQERPYIPYVEGVVTDTVAISYTNACAATQRLEYPVLLSISYYSPTLPLTSSFTTTPGLDSGLQWITVTIRHKGEEVFVIGDYKAER